MDFFFFFFFFFIIIVIVIRSDKTGHIYDLKRFDQCSCYSIRVIHGNRPTGLFCPILSYPVLYCPGLDCPVFAGSFDTINISVSTFVMNLLG
ncbi:hypothetical protein BLOT_014854 [Blomia tropicalis]|nr:hypothetical protein BLOT_014854 [Blomia tropicalis]